ncbi:P-loop containing nucleoside triphosphate hydrolase [Babesia duncani]|uniref:P-loop containing nucleoside triphosphate hydrolase n=1 Tax=Babesia duncani TaxID=323732 RepID=A0AAD9PL16_9APIC|nr:P-loop containing nucleoside triphosphate hydrolase [Babesia duncani]
MELWTIIILFQDFLGLDGIIDGAQDILELLRIVRYPNRMDYSEKEHTSTDNNNNYIYPWVSDDTLKDYTPLVNSLNAIFNPPINFSINKHPEDHVGIPIRTCYDAIFERNSSNSQCQQVSDDRLYYLIRYNIHCGAGIAEIAGPSGSGKTTLCIHITQIIGGYSLFIDTCSGIDSFKLQGTKKIIPVALFDCWELIDLLKDFVERIKTRKTIPFCNVLAESVSSLVIDSLWIGKCLKTYQEQQKYYADLSSLLRKISWTYNIAVIVVRNTKSKFSLPQNVEGRLKNDFMFKWKLQCYTHINLDQRNFYKDNTFSFSDSIGTFEFSSNTVPFKSNTIKRSLFIHSCHSDANVLIPFSINLGKIILHEHIDEEDYINPFYQHNL